METFSFFLKDYGGKFFLYCNFNSSDLSDNLPSFYRECLNVWSKLTAKPAESREEVLKQILWNNQSVRINDKPVFNRRLNYDETLRSLSSFHWTLLKEKIDSQRLPTQVSSS